MERKRDRKERLKKYEEWAKEQEKRKNRLKDMQARFIKQCTTGGSNCYLNNSFYN